MILFLPVVTHLRHTRWAALTLLYRNTSHFTRSNPESLCVLLVLKCGASVRFIPKLCSFFSSNLIYCLLCVLDHQLPIRLKGELSKTEQGASRTGGVLAGSARLAAGSCIKVVGELQMLAAKCWSHLWEGRFRNFTPIFYRNPQTHSKTESQFWKQGLSFWLVCSCWTPWWCVSCGWPQQQLSPREQGTMVLQPRAVKYEIAAERQMTQRKKLL